MEELLREHLSRLYLTLGYVRFAELPNQTSRLYRICNRIACCPGGLEVEASGDCIDIKDFPGKVNAGVFFALEGIRIYCFETYASAGDEFFLESSLG